MTAYYNENDKFAAQWLRNLMMLGQIAPGHVDERDIRDVTPNDIKGYTQCHFFAGVGVWSLALRLAGWSDNRPVWTGSCPCQPFSAAGRGAGIADERHLWPHWHHLISECRPERVFGEQVASKDGLGWFDLVQADMEGTGYACGAIDLCAAGVGAPHWRQRLWFTAELMANANDTGSQGWCVGRDSTDKRAVRTGGLDGVLEHTTGIGRKERGAKPSGGRADTGRAPSVMADAERNGQHGGGGTSGWSQSTDSGSAVNMANATSEQMGHARQSRERTDATSRPNPTNGFWADADWIGCTDGKFRPVEPRTFPLVNGATGRVGKLRAYGNAIVPQVAEEIIRAVM